MKIEWDRKYQQLGFTAFLVIISSVLFFFIIYRFDRISSAFSSLMSILAPFIYALIFVFLLVPIMSFFEQHFLVWLQKPCRKMRQSSIQLISRILGILITIVLAILIFSLLIGMVLPQLITSIIGFANDLPGYIVTLQDLVSEFLANNPEISGNVSSALEKVSNNLTEAIPNMNKMISSVATGAMGVVTALKNILVGLIVSIYIMFSKERFIAQSKKLLYALLSTRRVNFILNTARRIHRVFYGFLVGKILDSCIIGVLCYIAMCILRMPFALLISVIIGVTNIVPFFGPIIGAVPCVIILLLEKPLSGLYFIILIIVLQQLDGNVIGPKILGDSTGLSNFWIIFSIVVGGGLFGLPGMILGAPIFAVLYDFIRNALNRKLKNKGIECETDEFTYAAYVDPKTKQIVSISAATASEAQGDVLPHRKSFSLHQIIQNLQSKDSKKDPDSNSNDNTADSSDSESEEK